MTVNSFNDLKRDLRSLTSSVQASLACQIERISQKKLINLDGNEYSEGIHETLANLISQFKLDLKTSSSKKLKREIVLRASLNYLSKSILLKYLNDLNYPSEFKSKLPKTVFDCFNPPQMVMTNLYEVLEKYNFRKMNDEQIGAIYQQFLESCQQQQALGAFYTPKETVDYMISKLNLSTKTVVIDPACGNGHLLVGCIVDIKKKLMNAGHTDKKAAQQAISQVWGVDIDPFAVLLSKIRLFFLNSKNKSFQKNNVLNFNSLEQEKWIHTPIENEIDCIVCNPPYGSSPQNKLKRLYRRIYRDQASVYGYKLGGNDLYGFFLAHAIKTVKDGGTICFIISDTFLSLKSHTVLRRLILDTCKINEILLAPIELFRPMTTSRTCIITLTKHLCEKEYSYESNKAGKGVKRQCECITCNERRKSRIKLVDRLKNQSQYPKPPKNVVQYIYQEEYEYIIGNPFWINIPSEFIQIMRYSNPVNQNNVVDGWKFEELRMHIDGGEGISTGDNYSHLVVIRGSHLWKSIQGSPKATKFRVLKQDEITDLTKTDAKTLEKYRYYGIEGKKYLVPFEKGSDTKYWGSCGWYIDWSPKSVEKIKNRAKKTRGRNAVFRNPHLYFQRGIITDAHNGILSATAVENAIPAGNTNLIFGVDIEIEFLLGYLNSRIASYFLGKIINTSLGGMSGHVTPENIKRLPILLPVTKKNKESFQNLKKKVVQKVKEVISLLEKDLEADYSEIQRQIDDLIFEWFNLSKTEKKLIDNYLNRLISEKNRY